MNQLTCMHCGDTYPDFDVAHVCSKGPYAPKLKPKMNERIYELFEQALKEFKQEHEYATYIVPDPIKEKFAELVVRECGIVADRWVDDEDNGHNLVSDKLRQHFGVEE